MTRRNYFMKSISIIFMLLAMLFSCEPENENNDSNNSGNNTTQNGNNSGNTGEDNKDDVVTTGKIVGKATYTNTANHAEIQVTLVSSDGIVAYDSQISSRSRSTIAVMKNVVTSESGEYSFTNVKEGVYTIYASSDDSTEKAVLTNVVVQANKVVTAADLNLTATGSISGKVTLDGKENGNLGIMVFVASTSYMSMTDDSGKFTISDVPAGADYQIVIMKGDYCTLWETVSVEAGKENKLGEKNITSQNSDDKNYSFIWQGSSATPPANPEKYWAYFNTDDGCSYIYDGEKWTLLAQAGKDGENGNGGSSVEYKITYELNGGINNPDNPFFFTEDDYIYIEAPTKDGYTFAGWYETADFSEGKITRFDNIAEKRTDVTLYAKWVEIESSSIFLSGLNGVNWATDTSIGDADAMTKGENDVWTFTFTAETTIPFPYGFKFSTENGWLEQYQAYDKNNPTTNLAMLQPGEEAEVYFATQAELEAPDEDGNRIPDNVTKFTVESFSLFIVDNEYTITFDKTNMKVKISGDFEELSYYDYDLEYISGNMTDSSMIGLTDNTYTFVADYYNYFTFYTADGGFYAGGATITALDTEFALVANSNECYFADGVLTEGKIYTITLIVKGEHEAYVKVTEAQPGSISITNTPYETSYYVGEELNLDGLTVEATYSDGSTFVVTVTSDMVSGFDSSVAGTQTLTVTYEDCTATFNVEVVENSVSNINILNYPSKTSYYVGEELDVSGLEIEAVYSDGSTSVVTVTSDMVSGFDSSVVGTKTLTVTYEDCTVNFDVEVIEE